MNAEQLLPIHVALKDLLLKLLELGEAVRALESPAAAGPLDELAALRARKAGGAR